MFDRTGYGKCPPYEAWWRRYCAPQAIQRFNDQIDELIISLSDEKQSSSIGVAKLLRELGLVHWRSNDYPEAIRCLRESFKMFGQAGLEAEAWYNQVLRGRLYLQAVDHHIDNLHAVLPDILGISAENAHEFALVLLGEAQKAFSSLEHEKYWLETMPHLIEVLMRKRQWSEAYKMAENYWDVVRHRRKFARFPRALYMLHEVSEKRHREAARDTKLYRPPSSLLDRLPPR